MYLVEYMINGELKLDDILEQQFGQFDDPNADPENAEVANDPVEFEDLKKYVLYNKLKDVKLRLEMLQLDRKDPEVISILQFVELVSLFFNSFSYQESVDFFDTLVVAISEKLNIELPKREFEEPPTKPEEVQQAPMAQAGQQQIPQPQPGQQQIPQPQQQPQQPQQPQQQ